MCSKGHAFWDEIGFFWFLSALRQAETLFLHPVQIFAVEAGVWLEMGGSVWQGRFGIMCRASCSIQFPIHDPLFPIQISFIFLCLRLYLSIYHLNCSSHLLILSRLALSSLVISFLICLILPYLNLILSYGMLIFVVLTIRLLIFPSNNYENHARLPPGMEVEM